MIYFFGFLFSFTMIAGIISLFTLHKKNATLWKYKSFLFRNQNLILSTRTDFSSKLDNISNAIELYKKTQNGYFKQEDIDFESIQNMKKFMELYSTINKNASEAEAKYKELINLIAEEYQSLISNYHQDILKSYYDELIDQLLEFHEGIIGLYNQSKAFMDAIKSIYEGVLNDKLILNSILENAIYNEEYLQAAALRDMIMGFKQENN